MKMDNQLAAFICGLFVGLMVVRHVKRKVVEVDVEATKRVRQEDSTESETSYPRVLRQAN